MKTQMRSAEEVVRRAILEPGFLGRIKELLVVVAMLSMAFVVVLVLSAKNTHGALTADTLTESTTASQPAKDVPKAVSTELTATRCIVTPDGITPGSKFVVMVELHPNKELERLELCEEIPEGWTVAPINSAGAKKVCFPKSDPSKLIWTWGPIRTGDTKTVFYDVTVPSTTKKGNYLISGKIIRSDKTETTVGGEVAVDVKKLPVPEDAAEPRITFWQAIVIVLIILVPFGLILYLGWYKDHKLDKGEMRRAIAGTFVIGFTLLMMLSVSSGIYQKEVVLMYIQLAGVVIAFYFGAKIAAEISGVGAKIEMGKPAPTGPPTVKNINPPKGKGKVPVTIEGTGFSKGAQVKLRQADQAVISVPVEDKDITTSTKITRTFDLTDKTDTWKVVVINPDKKESEPVEFKVVVDGH